VYNLVLNHGLLNFLFDQVPNMILIFQKLLVTLDGKIARTLQGYLYRLFYPTGAGTKNNDSVRQVDSLIDLVGNEQYGFARFAPDTEQFRLHKFTSLSVESSEGGNP
jgi:hypothetical protein